MAEPRPSATTTPHLGVGHELMQLLWHGTLPVVLQDTQFRMAAVNPAYLATLGYHEDELLGRVPDWLSPREDWAELHALRQRIRQQPDDPALHGPLQRRLIDATGRERWFQVDWRAFTDADGQTRYLSVLQDRTLEHSARQQAERSGFELAQWFDLSPLGLLVVDEDGLVLRCNAAFEALVGRAPAQMTDLPPELAALLAWDAEARPPTLRADLQPEGAALQTRGSLQLPDGRVQQLRARLRAFRGPQGQRRAMVVLEDRNVEDERNLARLEMGVLMDAAGVGVATYEAQRGWLRPSVGPRAGEPGERPPAPALQSIGRDLVEPDSLADYDRLQAALREGRALQVRYAVRHPEIGTRWLLTRVEPGELGPGRPTVSVVTLDVTEQESVRQRSEQLLADLKLQREALQLAAERTRAILDSVLVGIVTVGRNGIEWMNRSARRMFAGELADFIGTPLSGVATDEPDHPFRRTHYLDTLADGQAETFECRLRGRDGRTFWVVGNAVVTGGRAGGDAQITFALLDIERRRQAELAIAQAQASLQRIIETAPMAIALFDSHSQRVLRLNQMAAMFFGRPMQEVEGHNPAELLPPAAAAQLVDDLQAAQSQPDGLRAERRLPTRADGAGELRQWDVRIVALAAGQPQLLLVASDVTEQRAAEQARFDDAVAQREMLVREVHHRIKNNLQGVAGLLQQAAVARPEVAPLLTEAIGQVQAIAQVHGLQVGAGGPLRILPVLQAIAGSVARNFGRAIVVSAVPQPGAEPAHRFALPEADSIPIALTFNELFTNAVKHGQGEVRCTLLCGADQVRVEVANQGRLPPGFNLAQVAPGISGLGLARALLPRRHASFTLTQQGEQVLAAVTLSVPGISLLPSL
jgi:PAS domain S-box-containing protein